MENAMMASAKSTVSTAATIRPAPFVTAVAQGGETVLLNIAAGQYYSLNDVGTCVWELLAAAGDAGLAAGSVIEHVQREYDVTPDRAQADVLKLLHDLRIAGLVICKPK
jgi:hypothetical protein